MNQKEIRQYLSNILPDKLILDIEADKAPYNIGYRYGKGNCLFVLKPENITQLTNIVKFCSSHKISIVVQGGNTGLVGSSVAMNNQILVSMANYENKQIIVNQEQETAIVGAGVILEQLNNYLYKYNLFFPIDLGSKGSCQLGGMASTNAAGIRALYYGDMLDRIISYQVLLADLTIKEYHYTGERTSNLQQDNSIINLHNPHIGSGGSFGIITNLKLKLAKLPKQNIVFVLVVDDILKIQILAQKLLDKLAKYISALEIVPCKIYQEIYKYNNIDELFAKDENIIDTDYSLIVELSSINSDKEINLQQIFEEYVIDLCNENLVKTARMDNRSNLIWEYRHIITDTIKNLGQVIAFDISVKNSQDLCNFIIEAKKKLQEKYPSILCREFGHFGRSALHFNLIWTECELLEDQKLEIQEYIYDLIINKYQGSISAEHGIGPHNQYFKHKFIDKKILEKEQSLKKQFDSNNIFNPNILYG